MKAAKLTEPVRAARIRMAGRLLDASIQGRRHRRAFDGVQAYCMFIGYPRSGHSLVGALLDAHPNVLITHELDALRFVHAGHMTRDRLFWLIVKSDRDSAVRRHSGPREYSVAGQWQGRYEGLRVIGDKMGGETTLRLRRHPDLLEQLKETVGVDVRIVHVVRNPYDNISTMSKRERRPLADAADRYFRMCEENQRIRDREGAHVLDVRHEDLIADPGAFLTRVLGFLGVDAPADYLDACGAIVFDSPNRSRTTRPWTPELIEDVDRRAGSYGFLDGYAFEERTDGEPALADRTEP